MVGAARFELATPGPPDRCANRAALRSDAAMIGRVIYTLEAAKQAVARGLRLLFGGGQNPATGLELVEKGAECLGIWLWHPSFRPGRREGVVRTSAPRSFGSDVGDLMAPGHGIFIAISHAPKVHDETRSVLAQDLLYAPNGVAIVVEQEPDAAQKRHVLGTVVPPAPAPLHRLEVREFGLPAAQDMLWDLKLVSNLADGSKRLGPLVQSFSSSASNLASYSAAFLRESASLMRCFMMLLARNTRTRRGVIGTSWPVFGLRPILWPLSRIPNEPNEDSFTVSPRSRLATISRSTSSTISADSFRGKPTF